MPEHSEPSNDPVARELLRELRELPTELRLTLARSAHTPEAVGHLARAMEHTLDEVGGDSSARHLREQATSLRAQIARAVQLLLELQAVAGRLDGLAWAVEAMDTARAIAARDE